jgi:hypothetical protein
MNAAQMLAAAGEPNTTAGRAKFHQRFPSKAAFDAWYTPKKEYGGGLTDGIAFPQQPVASYAYGGDSAKQFFAPNYMPFNGPVGFYEHGGMTNEIAFPQQPTEHINFSAFPWKPKYDMGGLPGGSNDMPCLECGGNMAYGGYMQPGGYVQAPDADAYFAAQDAAANYPAQGTNINYDYSKVTDPNTSLLNNYTADELNRMGANLPVANPVQEARFKKINDYNKEHPIIPADGGLFKYSSPKSGQEGERLQYANGKYQLYTPPPNPVVVNKYGGYMQTGGTTQMDQGQYTNGMAQEYLKSLANFNMSAQPMPMGNVQEAGYGAYGTEVNYNQMEDFNTLDMNAVDQMSSMENRLDDLKNKQTSIFDLGRNLTNIGSSIYQKPMSYKTKTVGSGYVKYGGNMFKNGGLQKFQGDINGSQYNGIPVNSPLMQPGVQLDFNNPNYAAQAAINTNYSLDATIPETSPLKKPATKLDFTASDATKPTNTNVGNTNDNAMGDTRMTADELAYFRGMMRGSNQGNYAPSWQAQQNQNNGYDVWKAISRDPEALKKFLSNSGIQDMKWNNKMGMFGPKSKGHITFRTYYDPSTGKTVQVPTNQDGMSRNYDSTKTGKEAKGPGFIKNLIAKNKQRKADKISKKYPLTQQEMEQRPDLNPQVPAPRSNKLFPDPATSKTKYEEFVKHSYRPTPKPVYGPGFEYGGFPQYNYGGYPEYEEGAEVDMSPEEIANYLAMGGTLEYLD